MKRFYVVLFSVLCVSVVLLGFSFSKETGSNELSFLNEDSSNDYRVVYSNGNILNTVNNSRTVMSFTNRKNELVKIVVSLKEKDNLKYKNVFYKVNDGPEHVLVNEDIELGELEAYGLDGDHKLFTLNVYTKDNSEYNFEIKIKETAKKVKNNITEKIKLSNSVYTDKKGDLRYYGEVVDNYIRYNGEVHRIIGVVDGKLKIISNIVDLGVYDTNKGEYATLEDYLGTYNNSAVNIDNVLNYKSWINDKGFWLLDTVDDKAFYGSATNGLGLYRKNVDFYLRYVNYIDGDAVVLAGNGSLNNPYEVSYGS